jgi:Na+(H+)/acetate symporter ActP
MVNKIIELCLTVFYLYFIFLCNTAGMPHLKVITRFFFGGGGINMDKST